MTFDPDWPHGHVTADGRKVRILGRMNDRNYPLVGVISEKNGQESVTTINENGDNGFTHLVNVPAPKRKFEFWLNFYDDPMQKIPTSKEEADKLHRLHWPDRNRIACKHVIIEEGEGLGD